MPTQVASLFGELKLVDSFSPGLDQAQNKASGFSKGVSASFAAVGTALLAIGAASVKTAAEWESAFANVAKTVDGSQAQLDALEQQLLAMATDRTNPVSGLENAAFVLAEIAEQAGQLGIATEDIAKFSETVALLRVAAESLGDDAATQLGQFMNVTGLSVDNVDRLANAIVGLGNKGASSEADIMAFAQRIGAAGTQAGLSVPEILGWSSAMASLGLNAEAGSTAWIRVLDEMIKASAMGGDNLASFAQAAGMTASQFASLVENDPSQAITAFASGIGRLSSAQQISLLESLGLDDVRITALLRSLAGGIDTVTDSLEVGQDAWDENNAAFDEAAKKADKTTARWNRMNNQLTKIKIGIGKVLLPIMNGFLDLTIKAGDELGKIGSMVPAFVEGLGKKFGPGLLEGWNKAVTAAQQILTLFAIAWDRATTAAQQLFILFGIGWDRATVAAQQLLAIVFYGLDRAAQAANILVGAAIDGFGWIKVKAGELWDSITYNWGLIKTAFGDVFTYMGELWDGARNKANEVWASIESRWDMLKLKLDIAFTSIKGAWEEVKTTASGVWEAIKTKVDETWTKINNTISLVRDGLWNAWNNVLNKINEIWNRVQKVLGSLREALNMAGQAASGGFVPGGNIISGAFGSARRFLGFAEGGDFAAGQRIMVGEEGPEVVRFNRPGTVFPNNATSSPTININILAPMTYEQARVATAGAMDAVQMKLRKRGLSLL